MNKTIEQINEEIKILMQQKEQVENTQVEEAIFDVFQELTKGEILLKLKDMVNVSPLFKMEIQRLIIK